ncbi:MAG: hypothetical protein RL456_949 [Pseudomonadota bacterium]
MMLAAVLTCAGLALHGAPWDRAVFAWLNQQGARMPVAGSMLSVAGLGLSAFIGLAATCAAKARPRLLAALIWCFPVGGAITHVLKRLLEVPRPAAVLSPETVWVIGEPLLRGAMPSGHALTAAAVCALIWLGGPAWRAWRMPVLAMACGVMMARVMVAAHWPSDVLVGAGLGVMTGWTGWQLAGRGPLVPALAGARGQRLLGLVQIVAGVAMMGLHTGYPLAMPLQWVLGLLSVWAGAHRLGWLRGRSLGQAWHLRRDG